MTMNNTGSGGTGTGAGEGTSNVRDIGTNAAGDQALAVFVVDQLITANGWTISAGAGGVKLVRAIVPGLDIDRTFANTREAALHLVSILGMKGGFKVAA
jgi:hypothetical protein